MEQAEKEAAKTEQQQDKDTTEVCISVDRAHVPVVCGVINATVVECIFIKGCCPSLQVMQCMQ